MSLALSLVLDENGVCSEMHAAATCLGSFPRRVRKLDTLVSGQKLTEALINTIADHCQRQINPLDNIMVDTEWRKEMVPVLVKRAIAAALA